MFTNTYLPHVGGVARSVSTFASDLRTLGHRVLVVAPTFDAQPQSEDEKHVLRVAAIQHFNGSDFSVRIPLPGVIEKKIRRFRPDIIHSHHPFLLGDSALRTAEHFELPIVFTHHTLYERYTHYVPFDSEGMKRFVIHLATEYANLCNGIIAPSSSIKKLLRQRGVQRPIAVVPTGIDTEYFRQGNAEAFKSRYKIPPGYKIIGHVGRLAEEKNLSYLASAVCHFLKKREKALFVISGKGDAGQEIKKIFAAANLDDRLIMPGILQGNSLADCYRAMDLFVFASKSETQGLVLMEAMAAGVPVIALRASGVSDVVDERKNGRILRTNCSEQNFAKAIDEAFNGPEIEQWRLEAAKTARRFSRRNSAERLSKLYKTVIFRNRGLHHEMDVLETIRNRVKAEWELFQEKASAMLKSMSESE